MKRILFILLLLPSLAFAQLSGKYCWTLPHFAYDCYTFLPGYKFKCESSGCTGGSTGHGTYTLTDTTLTFHFEKYTGSNNSTEILFDQKESATSDSTTIQVYVYDNVDSQPLRGAVVYLYPDTNYITKTNTKGYASLKVPGSNRKLTIYTRYKGTSYMLTEFSARSDLYVEARLPVQPYRYPGRTDAYITGIVSKELIELRSTKDKEFTIYKKF